MLSIILSSIYRATGLNWVDLIILSVLLFYTIEGIVIGVISALFDFIKFILSFVIGLKFYVIVGKLLAHVVSLSQGFSYAIGFFIASFIGEILLHYILKPIFMRIASISILQKTPAIYLSRIFGAIPGLLSGIILMTFLSTVIVTLPLSPFIKKSISSSKIGSILLSQSQMFEKDLSGVFGGAARDTLNFFTVEPQSNEIVKLHFATTQFSIDKDAEQKMLILVNQERANSGRGPLSMDPLLQNVAREHAADMLTRGYFSHYTPEGLSPFDRMTKENINYTSAGENLAFSPNVNLAMQGLMNSPGHRENILHPQFHKAGIGVLDAGIYGEMFVQEFTD